RKEFEEKAKEIDKIVKEKDSSTSKVSVLETELLKEKNLNIEAKRNQWISNELKKWRNKTWIEFSIITSIMIAGIVYVLYKSNWNFTNAIAYFTVLKSNSIISGAITLLLVIFNTITIKTLFGKYRNHSNIKSYREGLPIPNDLKELK
ncbi:hypothetical protein H0I72_10520, partial [Flavobacterium psychrophilum]